MVSAFIFSSSLFIINLYLFRVLLTTALPHNKIISMSSKFETHIEMVRSFLPELNGIPGFLFYSFIAYLIALCFGWLLDPTVDKIIADDIKSETLHKRGARMRK